MATQLQNKVDEMRHLEREIAVLTENLAAVKAEINDLISGQLAEIRKLQAKEFGAVNITADGFKITETVPKKVKWDQAKMANLFTSISAHGDNPWNYMKVEFSTPEKIYDDMQPEVRALFDDARTVEPGKPTLKIEEVANA